MLGKVFAVLRLLRHLRSSRAAIDLASIMVGVLIIGLLAGVASATVFAVIPWSQNQAAQADLNVVHDAEAVARIPDAACPARGQYLDSDNLDTCKLLPKRTTLTIAANANGTCFTAVSFSASGDIFWTENTSKKVHNYPADNASVCADVDQIALDHDNGAPMVASYSNATFPNGSTGVKLTPTVTGGKGTYTYSLSASDQAAVTSLGVGFNTATGEITGPSNWGQKYTSISSGSAHECGITNTGKLYCRGYNNFGQLGIGTTVNTAVPTPVGTDGSGLLGGRTVIAVAAGYTRTCALNSAGDAYCWGDGAYGGLGDGAAPTPTRQALAPLKVKMDGVLAGKKLTAISTGGESVCVIADDDLAYCWGRGDYAGNGDNTTTHRGEPVAVVPGAMAGKKVTSISAGVLNTCAVADDRQVYCWGYGNYGGVGDGATLMRKTPVAVSTATGLAGKTIKSVNVQNANPCVVTDDNQLFCWGYNNTAQVGTGNFTNQASPFRVNSGDLAGKAIGSVYGGHNHSCAIDTAGIAYCWGSNSVHQTKNSSTTSFPTPVVVPATGSLAGVELVAITGFDLGTCALSTTGQQFCWGSNVYGRLGDNNVATGYDPVQPRTIGLTFNTSVSVKVTDQKGNSVSVTVPLASS